MGEQRLPGIGGERHDALVFGGGNVVPTQLRHILGREASQQGAGRVEVRLHLPFGNRLFQGELKLFEDDLRDLVEASVK